MPYCFPTQEAATGDERNVEPEASEAWSTSNKEAYVEHLLVEGEEGPLTELYLLAF